MDAALLVPHAERARGTFRTRRESGGIRLCSALVLTSMVRVAVGVLYRARAPGMWVTRAVIGLGVFAALLVTGMASATVRVAAGLDLPVVMTAPPGDTARVF